MDWLKSLFRISKTKEEVGYDALYQVVDVETNDKRYLNVERVLKYGVLRDVEPSVGEQQVRHVRVNVYSCAGLDARYCPDPGDTAFCRLAFDDFKAGHYDSCKVYDIPYDDYVKCKQ